jgi:hypothetical protein
MKALYFHLLLLKNSFFYRDLQKYIVSTVHKDCLKYKFACIVWN